MFGRARRFAVRGAPSPGRLSIWLLGIRIRMAARREVRNVVEPTGKAALPGPIHWQDIVVKALDHWLEELAMWASGLMKRVRAALREAIRERQAVDVRLEAARKRASRVDPRFEFSPWLMVLVVLATVLGAYSAWSFVEDQLSSFVPLTVIAASTFGVIEIVIAGLLGRCLGALILDLPDGPNELDAGQRVFNLVASVTLLVVLAVVAVLLATARGNVLLWLALTGGIATAGVYLGIAAYDERHQRAVDRLERKQRRLDRLIGVLKAQLDELARVALGKGRQLRGLAGTILSRAGLSFQKAWRRRHRGKAAPGLPAVGLPGDDKLAAIVLDSPGDEDEEANDEGEGSGGTSIRPVPPAGPPSPAVAMGSSSTSTSTAR